MTSPVLSVVPGTLTVMDTCGVEGCGGKHLAKGFCNRHWHANARWGDPLGGPRKYGDRAATETPDTKRCSRCEALKPLDEFGRQPRGRKRVAAWCKVCQSAYSKAYNAGPKAKSARRAYKNTPAGREANRLSRVRVRLGPEGVAAEVRRTSPDAACDACGSARLLAVDHCHGTQRVRGVLCHNCNVALGLVADDPARLRALADYLERAA